MNESAPASSDPNSGPAASLPSTSVPDSHEEDQVATKADIRLLQAEIVGSECTLTEKTLGFEQRVTLQFQATETVFTTRIDGVERRFDEKIDGVEKRLNDKIDTVAANVDALRRDMSAGFLEVSTQLQRVNDRLDALFQSRRNDWINVFVLIVGFAGIIASLWIAP